MEGQSEAHAVVHRSPQGDQAIRASHVLDAPLQRFDFEEEVAALRAERPFREHDRNAKTLVKSEAFRVVLVVLRAGAAFDEGDSHGHMSVLVRDGELSVEVGTDRATVGPGQIAVSHGHAWRAKAERDTVAILHIGWPS